MSKKFLFFSLSLAFLMSEREQASKRTNEEELIY